MRKFEGMVREKFLTVLVTRVRLVACWMGVSSVHARNDGVEKVKTMIRQGSDGTLVPINNR